MSSEEHVPTSYSDRVYLITGGSDYLWACGPINEGIQAGDSILCFYGQTKEQWSCEVIAVFSDQTATVKRL